MIFFHEIKVNIFSWKGSFKNSSIISVDRILFNLLETYFKCKAAKIWKELENVFYNKFLRHKINFVEFV